MKKYIYGLALLTLLPGCSDNNFDDPEEPFVDPYPVNKMGPEDVTCGNPLVLSDVPDPSVIRVGNDYYMVSTSMHLTPGCQILHSTDLVGWEIIGYVFRRLEGSVAGNLEYDADLDKDNLYANGSWAASLAYDNGKFYCLWNYYGQGNNSVSFISSATDPAGEWKVVRRFDKMYYDASLFFDDDHTPYIIAAHTNAITRLNPDLSESGEEWIIDTGVYNGEGYQFCKANGKYYLFMMYWPEGGLRSVVALRADNIAGPYTPRQVLSSKIGGTTGDGVAQGRIIDTPDGEWFGLFFTDMGAIGRCPVLTQCRWVNGWPMLGNENGVVEAVTPAPRRASVFSTSNLVESDDFSSPALSLQWQWNHNPDDESWSLDKRKGYLRLTTSHIAEKGFYHARNTLTTRTLGPSCRGEICIELDGMKDGDVAGLAIMQYASGMVAVTKENGLYKVFMADGTQTSEFIRRGATATLSRPKVYLRATANFTTNLATYFYSPDGSTWIEIGNSTNMEYSLENFVGNRFAIFNYATESTGGYVDVDYFNFARI